MDIAALTLPRYTHATVLTGRDIVVGGTIHNVIVWADRTTSTCDQCHQPIAMEIKDCPVLLDTGAGAGGAILETSKQHGCGNWLTVDWTEVKPGPAEQPETCDDCETTGINCSLHDGPEYDDEIAPGVTSDQVLAAARELADRRAVEIGTQATSIENDLRADLRAALAALDEPLADGETMEDRIEDVSSGSETEPGVYCDDDGRWQAWEYDPASEFGATITVYADDLAQVTR